MTRHFIPWTDAMDARLRELAADPLLSYGRIADIMEIEFAVKFSKNACVGRAHRLNVPPRPSPIEPPGPRGERRIELRKVSKPLPPAQVGGSMRIEQLGGECCRFPHGEEPPFLYCGMQTVPHRPYCAKHCAVAYYTPRKAL